LRAALNGSGPALAPAGPEQPPLRPGEDDPDDPTALVLATSGSSGPAKQVLLPSSALLASASATHDRLGGPGRWLLALPARHVAGLQVLVRSLVTGAPPTVLDLDGGFDPAAFAAAAAATGRPGRAQRRYTSLVPTQLVRLLDAGGAPLSALAGFDAVLVGGAATPAPLRERARAAGVRLVTTYGMSETAGGCVYDGLPLDGVRAAVEPGGRVLLAGPVLARGHRGPGGPDTAAFTVDGEGRRWLRTDDEGRLDGDLLAVTGRLDDVIVTGGMKVAPGAVQAALLDLPGVAEAVVVGVEDPQWGSRVVAAVVPHAGTAPDGVPTLDDVRRAVGARLGAHAAPRQLLVLGELPLRGPGKPDLAAVRAIAAGR
jgi:O-succinylbenzoic acid--CoA ligase